MQSITRRKFNQIISAAGLAGTALLETMHAEMQDAGAISPESVRSFLALTGTKVQDDQIVVVQASLTRALDSMKRIRDRIVPQNREPAVMFRVRR
jgi:mRNA-degrading endonuclease HigB of HigAB toxin-antitoxin module